MVDLMDGESFVCGDKRKAGSSPVGENVEDRSRSSATKSDVKRRAIGISDDSVVHDNDSNIMQNLSANENEEEDSENSEEDMKVDGLNPGEMSDEEEDMDSENSEEEMDGGWLNPGEMSDEEDDMDPPKQEVEELLHSLGDTLDQQVTFELYLQDDDGEFRSWMQTIHVRCCYDGKVIGKGLGRFVKRGSIRSEFWLNMEEPCQELADIAFEIFDRYGRLKQEFMDHVVRKGTACWGSELHRGSLFVIEYTQINKQWRRKGIGRKMITSLIEKAGAGGRSPAFTLVSPGWLNDDVTGDIDGKSKTELRELRVRARSDAISFYRSLGFRRIGASYCFGLATDPNHKAHKISTVDDFDPPEEEAEENEPSAEDKAKKSFEDLFGDPDKSPWRLKLLQNRLPLHHATITLSDNECVEFYNGFKKSESPKEDWVKADRFHNNVLHVAATEQKVKSVQWLLENANEDQLLSAARNVKGYTPLEELESHLESKRTVLKHGMMTICISDRFRGHPNNAIECLAALSGDEIPTDNSIKFLRLKFGCTCGQCIDGFLSPRMKFALLCQAEINHDMLDPDFESAEMWCMMNDNMFVHVAPDIQRNFATNKSLRKGFANVFDHVATALRASVVPSIDNVLYAWRNTSEWPPVTRNFYERGGSTESVLHIIFENARDQDEWAGDGDHMEVFGYKITELPECRNDHEFGFVASSCGVQNW